LKRFAAQAAAALQVPSQSTLVPVSQERFHAGWRSRSPATARSGLGTLGCTDGRRRPATTARCLRIDERLAHVAADRAT
jgi:hypothetical protein